ncbi:MAG: response regulator [Burkholderiales bacterium]|nr:response regulator [Burkholderiales bacterium]
MRMLLVEDDDVIARELWLRWQRSNWVAEIAGTLSAGSAALAQGSFDLIVLDLGLPDGDGLAWLGQLRERDRQTPVLVLTARDRVSDRVHGLRTGADDYLVKPFAVDELDARIEVLARRAQLARGDLAAFGALSWLGQEGCAYAAGKRLELSPREFEVLGMLIRRAPRLVPKRVLIDALAERNLEVGDSAAEVYVSRLRRKLAGSGTVIRTLRGFGYVLELEDGEVAKKDRG